MNRFTEKNKIKELLTLQKNNVLMTNNDYKEIKFGQLEDIEEELGIDLTTLFKALRQEVLFIKTDIGIKETIKNGDGWGMKHLSFEDGEFVIFAQIFYPNDITHKEWLTPLRLKLSDYGKTWALTEEELE